MDENNVKTRRGINASLFRVVSSPPEWVTNLTDGGRTPYFLTSSGLPELIQSFLSANTDSVRLVRASRASRKILQEYDMEELEDLRASVQASELLRVIPYSKQTDHSAHTLYLFLLGIYIFFACAPLRTGLAKFLSKKDNSAELVESFLFQWVFVSLLHDIGYIFQGRARSEVRAVDRMFRAASITRLLGKISRSVRRTVINEISNVGIRPFEPIQNPEDMLTTLRSMPWGRSAGVQDDIFETFRTWGPKEQKLSSYDLEDYAYRVASSGYDGFSEGTVDHAVASGLFLFRYSTFWYWLASANSFEDSFQPFQDDYSMREVTSACFATAAHNVIGFHAKDVGLIDFEANPLIYLGILCDELQKWDRFPAGERHLVDLQSFEKYCTDSERITLAEGWDKTNPILITFGEAELSERIEDTLNKRLASLETFITFGPQPDGEPAPATEPNSSGKQALQPGENSNLKTE